MLFSKKILTFTLVICLISWTGRDQLETAIDTITANDSIPQVDTVVARFMKKYNVPGMSIAISKDGKLVYTKGYGYANTATGEKVTPAHLFRIASVSKPITSAAIMQFLETDCISLDSKVFGDDGILGNDYGVPPPNSNIKNITVHQLLQHTSGGWANDSHDPMFTDLSLSQAKVIRNTLQNEALINEPGKAYAYSNFGYCVLGRIIEKISGGMGYEEYVKKKLLAKAGVTSMQVGGNRLRDRKPNEVVYYGQGNEDPYRYNITRMDSHGGWIATAADLLRFVFVVDGFETKPDILSATSIKTMTTASSANERYACGWLVNTAHNWWHNGSLPGTASELVRANNGFSWAILANTRSSDANFSADMDRMIWYAVRDTTVRWRSLE
ncbi:MAG: serine hydrolase domain-containing protein [Sediminibacterium sp.]